MIFQKCCLTIDSKASKQTNKKPQEPQTTQPSTFLSQKFTCRFQTAFVPPFPNFAGIRVFSRKPLEFFGEQSWISKVKIKHMNPWLALGQCEKDALCWDKMHRGKSDFSKKHGAGIVFNMECDGSKWLCLQSAVSQTACKSKVVRGWHGSVYPWSSLKLQCQPSSMPEQEPGLKDRSAGQCSWQSDGLGYWGLVAFLPVAWGW